MKTANIPSVRVEPEFREELEAVLTEGETVSSFVEKSLRESVKRRKTQAEFIKRGMESLARVQAGEPTIPANEVIAKLEAKLEAAKRVLAERKAVKP